LNQLGFPSDVTRQEIVRERDLGGAINLCLKAAGLEPKQVQDRLKMDKAQFSRWSAGTEGIVWSKFTALMDECGNDAPLLWMNHARGYDLSRQQLTRRPMPAAEAGRSSRSSPARSDRSAQIVPRGMLDATVEPETIARWWQRAPHAGVGIALSQSGLVAVDVDPRNGGTETFDQLQAEHGSLRSDVMAFTGGGGEHHVFVVPHGASPPAARHARARHRPEGERLHRRRAERAPERPRLCLGGQLQPAGRRRAVAAARLAAQPARGPAAAQRGQHAPRRRAGRPKQARDAREALYLLDADDHDDLAHAGMALHSTGWGHPAYAMWCAWAQQSSKFDATEQPPRLGLLPHRRRRGAIRLTLAWVFAEAQKRRLAEPAGGGCRGAGAGDTGWRSGADRRAALRPRARVHWAVKGVIVEQGARLHLRRERDVQVVHGARLRAAPRVRHALDGPEARSRPCPSTWPPRAAPG
jgi:hypothetical protein